MYSRAMKFREVLGKLSLALALVGAPLVAGCAPYMVVQKSVSPSALVGVQHVTVSYDWTQTRFGGKSEGEYVAEKSAEERADHEVVKTETNEAIMQALRDTVGAPYTFTLNSAPPGIGELRVVIQHVDIDTGIFTYVYNRPSRALTRFVWIRDGKVTDIIDTRSTVGASLTTASDHQRMKIIGRNLGRAAGAYFIDANHGKN